MVNNKDDRVFLSRNYRSDSCPWRFDVLKASILALEAFWANICFKNIKFLRGNYPPRQKHAIVQKEHDCGSVVLNSANHS